MRMTVITDKGGAVVGTARLDVAGPGGAGAGGPIAGPEQTVHVIDVPDDLADVDDASELHDKLRTILDE